MFEGTKFLRNVLRRMQQSKEFQERIMKGLGALALASAQEAFDQQALGSEQWEERYPKQKGFKANIAGIVADFAAGKRNPPNRRFDARPAGIDTGNLRRSLTPSKALTTHGFKVTVGSTQQNASAVQFGGETRQQITKTIVHLLADFMRRSRKRVKKAKKVSQPITAKDAAIQKLGFLFGLAKKGKPLITKSIPRPYLGITPELEDKMISFIVETFEDMEHGKSKLEKQ